MTKEIILLEMYKDAKKVAEVDITSYTIPEIKLIMELQEMQGRTWRTVRHKQFKEGE